jgi:hypothetical protein
MTAPSNGRALAVSSPQSALALVSEEDRNQAQLLKMTLPYGQKLTDTNAVALVAYCNMFGLNAQNGEAYFLVQESGGVRKELGLFPGIKAWRKKAKEQLHKVDALATYKIDYERINPTELGILKAKEGDYAICVRAKLTDDISRTKYLNQFVQLLAAGLKKEEIEEMIGKPPFWYGYGSVKVQELPYLKMEPLRVAEKRAEKDATSRRFDLPFADHEMAEDIAPEVVSDVDGSFTEIKDDKPSGKAPSGKALEAKLLGELNPDWGATPEKKAAEEQQEDPEPGEWVDLPENDDPLRYTPEQLKTRIAEIAKTTTGQVSNGKRGLVVTTLEAALSFTTDPKASRHQLMVYLTGADSLSKTPDNVILALYKWLNPSQDTSGEWFADAMSEREAVAAFNECQPPQAGLF